MRIFRKTSLQHALNGQHIAQTVRKESDATAGGMQISYARALNRERRHMSNHAFRRIHSSLPVGVAVRYGCAENPGDRTMEQLDAARSQGDWEAVARLSTELRLLKAADSLATAFSM